ncbi:MAG TPA: prepilin peptidase [Gemmatimonadaceae bacterium]|nr:prepilin peptidase [Gemmatimonadaceae bacterium]
MTDGFLLAFVCIVGGCIGSFLNVCVARWPAEASVVSPRSKCPNCGHPIAWYENIPVLSWIALRARCRGCKSRISVQYPLVEALVALGWIAAAWHYGISGTALRVAVFGTLLLGVMLTDAMHYIIPDGFTAFGLIWALLAAAVGLFVGSAPLFAGLYDAIIGACVGAGAIAIVGWLGEMAFKKEAMGFGDVTLMAMVGAHLGPGRTLLTIFLGAALGAVSFLVVVLPVTAIRSRRRGEETVELPLVPFGVFLAPAAMIALLWGQALLDWYLHGVLGL